MTDIKISALPSATSLTGVETIPIVQAGSTVKTTLGLIGSTFYNVKNYGAVGNGVADDTTAINATIAAATAGQTITFPQGTYNISSTISVAKALAIEIQSGATVFLRAASNSNSMFQATANNVTFFGGGTINANGANQSSGTGYCVEFFNASHGSLSGLELVDGVNAMISLHNANFCVVEDCFVHSINANVYGINANYVVSYCSILNNTFFVSGDAMEFVGTNGLCVGNSIAGNQIISARIGIEMFAGCPHTTVSNNVISGVVTTGNLHTSTSVTNLATMVGLSVGMNVYGTGVPVSTTISTINVSGSSITISNAATATSTGVTLSFNGSMGISMAPADNSTVVGNTLNNCGNFTGIESANSSYITISDNSIDGLGFLATAINLDGNGTGTGAVVTGNTIHNVVKGIYTANGYSTITGNFVNSATSNAIEFNGGTNHTCTANQVYSSAGVGIIVEECSYVTINDNIIDSATSNGIQFLAQSGPTRDYLTCLGNIMTAGVNALTFTGAHFGTRVLYEKFDDGGYTSYVAKQPLAMVGTGSVLVETSDGSSKIVLPAGNPEALQVTGTQTSTRIALINGSVNTEFATAGSSFTPYKTITASSGFIYTGNDIALQTDGGIIRLGTNGGEQLDIIDTANTVNKFTITGSAATTSPIIAVIGSDTNINLTLSPKAGFVIDSSVSATVTAAGNASQGSATLLTSDYNVVTTSSGTTNSVRLPTAVAGMAIRIKNTTGNTINVYPASGGQIDALGSNATFTLSTLVKGTFVASSTTQWYSF